MGSILIVAGVLFLLYLASVGEETDLRSYNLTDKVPRGPED